MLKASPAYYSTAMVGGLSDPTKAMPATDRTTLNRPNLKRDGHDQAKAKASDMLAERLEGRSVCRAPRFLTIFAGRWRWQRLEPRVTPAAAFLAQLWVAVLGC
jgi:hypothetical protein